MYQADLDNSEDSEGIDDPEASAQPDPAAVRGSAEGEGVDEEGSVEGEEGEEGGSLFLLL